MNTKEQSLIPKVFTHESFGKLRIVVIDGVIYFVAVDVAHALGYKNGSRDVNRHVDKADRLEYRLFVSSEAKISKSIKGQMRKTILVNESGFYSLILSSNLPSAKNFKHWVTYEVLPQICKTGMYSTEQIIEQFLKAILEPEPQLACVYALKMNNTTTKIGISGKLKERIISIKSSSGLKVLRVYSSILIARPLALFIEKLLKVNFSSQCVQGEFFSVDFEEACKAIDSFVKLVSVPAIASEFERGRKIFKVAKKIAAQSSNLLADKNP